MSRKNTTYDLSAKYFFVKGNKAARRQGSKNEAQRHRGIKVF
jgi:hypothetical protein